MSILARIHAAFRNVPHPPVTEPPRRGHIPSRSMPPPPAPHPRDVPRPVPQLHRDVGIDMAPWPAGADSPPPSPASQPVATFALFRKGQNARECHWSDDDFRDWVWHLPDGHYELFVEGSSARIVRMEDALQGAIPPPCPPGFIEYVAHQYGGRRIYFSDPKWNAGQLWRAAWSSSRHASGWAPLGQSPAAAHNEPASSEQPPIVPTDTPSGSRIYTVVAHYGEGWDYGLADSARWPSL